MSIFSALGSGIQSAYNYVRPTEGSSKNFSNSIETCSIAFSEAQNAYTNLNNGFSNAAKVVKGGISNVSWAASGCKSAVENYIDDIAQSDYAAVKVFATAALTGLVCFSLPTIVTATVLTYPITAIFTTTALTCVGAKPEKSLIAVKDLANGTLDDGKTLYHSAKAGFELVKAGMSLGCEVNDSLYDNTTDFNGLLDEVFISTSDVLTANDTDLIKPTGVAEDCDLVPAS